MFDAIQPIDAHLSALAQTIRGPVVDALFGFFSNPLSALLLAPVALVWAFRRPRRALPVLVAIGVACAGADAMCGLVLKNAFPRTRPNGTHASFPSNHAANSAAAATVLALEVPVLAVPAAAAAACVGLSRIVLMKHWPSDVAAGALVGLLFGLLAARVKRVVLARMGIADASPPAPLHRADESGSVGAHATIAASVQEGADREPR